MEKLILETTPKLYDRYNDRQYAFEKNTKHCFVIIDQGRAMESWGLPRYAVLSAAKPFAEPASPLAADIEWVLEHNEK